MTGSLKENGREDKHVLFVSIFDGYGDKNQEKELQVDQALCQLMSSFNFYCFGPGCYHKLFYLHLKSLKNNIDISPIP